MRYADVEASIRQWAADADHERRRRMATYAVGELTQIDGIEELAAAEFTLAAASVFLTACRTVTAADAATIEGWLELIDEGTVSDGDMDAEALWALTAIEGWLDFLNTGDGAPVAILAITLLEVIDFEVGADVDNFLADPQIAAEYGKIQELLGQDGPVAE